MALADVVDERQEPESRAWSDDQDVRQYLQKKMQDLKSKSTETLRNQGFDENSIHFEEYLNLRYRGTESALMIIKPTKEEAEKEYNGDDWAFGKALSSSTSKSLSSRDLRKSCRYPERARHQL